ncbi:MAG TPA: hypothetical protein VHY82_11605 [Acetobacteraceae bacterium]|jgi:hypothetical protein|nr:hypothetical protein [Acetobacteraceae bacterium]
MLRIGYLPSDFNPMVLVLGDAEDFRLLAGVLRHFARDRTDVALHQLGFCAAASSVTLTASAGPPGVQPTGDNRFLWRVSAEQAAQFAGQIDRLAAEPRTAGSELLECTTEEEIPVKVSRGEYTDDFLMVGNLQGDGRSGETT